MSSLLDFYSPSAMGRTFTNFLRPFSLSLYSLSLLIFFSRRVILKRYGFRIRRRSSLLYRTCLLWMAADDKRYWSIGELREVDRSTSPRRAPVHRHSNAVASIILSVPSWDIFSICFIINFLAAYFHVSLFRKRNDSLIIRPREHFARAHSLITFHASIRRTYKLMRRASKARTGSICECDGRTLVIYDL